MLLSWGSLCWAQTGSSRSLLVFRLRRPLLQADRARPNVPRLNRPHEDLVGARSHRHKEMSTHRGEPPLRRGTEQCRKTARRDCCLCDCPSNTSGRVQGGRKDLILLTKPCFLCWTSGVPLRRVTPKCTRNAVGVQTHVGWSRSPQHGPALCGVQNVVFRHNETTWSLFHDWKNTSVLVG